MEIGRNQILLTISEDKKEVTVECGAFYLPKTYSLCPKKTVENIGNAIKAYDRDTGLSEIAEEWKPGKCAYENKNMQGCSDCN